VREPEKEEVPLQRFLHPNTQTNQRQASGSRVLLLSQSNSGGRRSSSGVLWATQLLFQNSEEAVVVVERVLESVSKGLSDQSFDLFLFETFQVSHDPPIEPAELTEAEHNISGGGRDGEVRVENIGLAPVIELDVYTVDALWGVGWEGEERQRGKESENDREREREREGDREAGGQTWKISKRSRKRRCSVSCEIQSVWSLRRVSSSSLRAGGIPIGNLLTGWPEFVPLVPVANAVLGVAGLESGAEAEAAVDKEDILKYKFSELDWRQKLKGCKRIRKEFKCTEDFFWRESTSWSKWATLTGPFWS
jgi:hypothetical protein